MTQIGGSTIARRVLRWSSAATLSVIVTSASADLAWDYSPPQVLSEPVLFSAAMWGQESSLTILKVVFSTGRECRPLLLLSRRMEDREAPVDRLVLRVDTNEPWVMFKPHVHKSENTREVSFSGKISRGLLREIRSGEGLTIVSGDINSTFSLARSYAATQLAEADCREYLRKTQR